jgi:basic membrane protein A
LNRIYIASKLNKPKAILFRLSISPIKNHLEGIMHDNSRQPTRYWRLLIPVGLGIAMVIVFMALLPEQVSASFEHVFPVESPQTITEGEVITIGVAQVINGPLDWIGWRQLNSVQLAVDQINAAGGIDIGGIPYTVTMVYTDSQCTSYNGGVSAANDLIAAGAVAVVGHSCSASSLGGQTVYNAAGVAMVSGSSTSPAVTEGGYTTTFRTITRDDVPLVRLATLLHNHMGIQSIALVDMDGKSDPNLTNIFSNHFTSIGGTVTSYQSLSSSSDHATALSQINGEGAEAIFYNNNDALEAGSFSSQATGMGMAGVQIAWYSGADSRGVLADYNTNAGTAAEGDLVLFNYRDTADMPGYATLTTDYAAAGFPNYGDEPGTFGAFAYDAAQYIFQAIDNADSTDPGIIRAALTASGQYQGVVGEYFGFDAKGDSIPQWYWFEMYQNGVWNELTPVGLVADGPSFDDGSFNMMSLEGLVHAESELLVVGETFTSTDSSAYEPNLEECSAHGNALCLSVGFMMNSATMNVALNHPETEFAIIDSDYPSNPNNLRYHTFAEDEAGYMAGALAGMMTTNDVVGAVGGPNFVQPVVDFVERYGHAATCVNPDVTAILSYTTSFDDPYLGAITAQDQMALGADVIFAAAGRTGNGAVLTATQSGAWAIGVDADQYITLFQNGAVDGSDRLLSSAMKRVDNAVFQSIQDIVGGLFTPGEYEMILANDGVGLAPFHETDPHIPGNVRSHLSLIEQGIISGDVDIYGACYTIYDIYIPVVMKNP